MTAFSLSSVPATAFPFTALVGHEALQRALLLAAIDPGMGGVLISGPRGTAKSTSARALAALLPEAPFVTLPLAASLEQLVGTLNLEDVLRDGQVRLAPGLVARAHGGVLYVDEVNLLPDALVDSLLDVAASGVNTVERDGVSHQHAARFVLVGTMNPEEGELRQALARRRNDGAQTGELRLVRGQQGCGVGLEGQPRAHDGAARGRVLRVGQGQRQAEAVEQLRAQFALLGVHGAHQHEARRVTLRDAVALNGVDAAGGCVQQRIDQRVG